MDLEAWHDQERAHTTDLIRRVGWAIQYVGGDCCSRPGCDLPPSDEPTFAYTIGLFGLHHPELLMIGVSPESATQVLNTLAGRVRAGDNLMPGLIVSVDGWPHRIVPEPVPNPGEIVLFANDYYLRPAEHSVPVLQLTYDDAAGRFPWDDGYSEPQLQPRPGTFTA